jgi:solute carrier family 35 protein
MCLKKKYVVRWGEAKECGKISVLSASNILFGAIGMKYVNLPMYIALRKLCTAKIFLIDVFVYNRPASYSSSAGVFFISLGAVIAGANDFTSDLLGYLIVFGSNLMNALLLIQIKVAKEKHDSLEALKQAYICSVISIPYILVLMYTFKEVDQISMSPFSETWELYWVIFFAGLLGIACNLTLFKAANEISPMATSIVGNAKDFISIFVGYVAFGDVNGNFLFVLGLCFSMFGAGVYSLGKLKEIKKISV